MLVRPLGKRLIATLFLKRQASSASPKVTILGDNVFDLCGYDFLSEPLFYPVLLPFLSLYAFFMPCCIAIRNRKMHIGKTF